jgi:hypothetical protein
MTIELNVGAETLTPVFPLIDPDIAVITVAAPTPAGGFVTAAPSPALLTLTMVASAELHIAVLVRFCVEPSV